MPRLISLLTACAVLGATIPPCGAAEGPDGEWRGEYTCAQGLTALDMTIARGADGQIDALFHFAAAPVNPGVPEGCFTLQGSYDAATGTISLQPQAWLLQPDNYVMVGLDGKMSATGDAIAGHVTEMPWCTVFTLSRVGEAPPRSAPCRPASHAVS